MREPLLDKISQCHVRDEKSNNWGRTQDFRNNNRYAFECAMHLFCPGQSRFLIAVIIGLYLHHRAPKKEVST